MKPKRLKKKTLSPNRRSWAGAWIRRGAGHSSSSIVGEKEAAAWLEALHTRGASPKTVGVYGNALASLRGRLAELGRKGLVDVTADDLAAWRLAMVASSSIIWGNSSVFPSSSSS